MKLKIALCAFLLSATSCLAAAADKAIPYSKFATALSHIPAPSEYPNLHARVVVSPPKEGPSVQNMIFTIGAGSGAIVVRPQPDGTIEWPLTPSLIAENPMVHVNIPPTAHFAVEARIEIRVSGNTRFAYADLLAAEKQYDKAIAHEVGLLSWFVPSVKGFQVFCGMGCTARLRPLDAVFKANDKGSVQIPLHREWAGSIVSLTASATKIEFIDS